MALSPCSFCFSKEKEQFTAERAEIAEEVLSGFHRGGTSSFHILLSPGMQVRVWHILHAHWRILHIGAFGEHLN
jgi:hypothetical protein